MRESFQSDGGKSSGHESRLEAAELSAAIIELERQADQTSQQISQAFSMVSDEIESSLTRAARNGELRFETMVESILAQLSRLAVEAVIPDRFSALEGLASNLVTSFIGQRAEGGPVLDRTPYLVGERGPEVFVPHSAGVVQPLSERPIQINVYSGTGTTETVRRSERQMAASLTRAVRLGTREL